MNRKLLALAVGAALSLPVAAQAAPTLYGLLNLSVDMVDKESTGDDNWQVNSNSSRLGVKGEEALGGSLSAVYQIEGAVDGSGDVGIDWLLRNRFVGLKGGFGTVKLGHYDSPLQEAQGSLDQFDDMTYTDMGGYLAGENRMSNLIGYESPKIADAITVKLVIQPGETNANDGPAEAMSASVAYEAGGFYLAAAMDMDASNGPYQTPFVDGAGNVLNEGGRDTIRLVGTYTMNALTLGAMVQKSELSNASDIEDGIEAALVLPPGTVTYQDDETAIVLSGAYAMGKNTFKAQLAMVENDDGSADELETMFIGLGYDHNFTQMTKVYGQYSMTNYEAGSADADDNVLSIGLQTKF